MIDYSSWQRKKLSVSNLKLDIQNPRLSGFGMKVPKQTEIIEYLLEHENIIQLAKDIAAIGYLPNEEPIVFKENGKYIVLEGNRRVSACKILIEPELVHNNNSKKRTLNRITNTTNISYVNTLIVIIAPSREAADTLIVNRHTKGSSIEKWDKTKQDRFFSIRHRDGETIEEMSEKFNLPKSAIKESITRFNFFEELLSLELSEKDKKSLSDETKFSMTNVERFYKSKKGREFLGIELSNKGKINHFLPQDEYLKRLKRVAVDVINNDLNSRSYGDEEDQERYLKKLNSNSDFDMSIVPSKKFEEEYISNGNENINSISHSNNDDENQEKPEKTKVLSSASATNKLIPPMAFGWKTDNIRINKIFKELKEANLDEQFNATAVLFRSYLDMIIYQYLNKQGAIIELIAIEQKKIDEENRKKIVKVANFIKGLGIPEDEISLNELKKVLNIKTGVSQNWVPSLKQMLVYISASEELLPDIKLRQALAAYLKGSDGYLGHNDLNLVVHNEYFIKDKKELKDTWNHLYPLLAHLNN